MATQTCDRSDSIFVTSYWCTLEQNKEILTTCIAVLLLIAPDTVAPTE